MTAVEIGGIVVGFISSFGVLGKEICERRQIESELKEVKKTNESDNTRLTRLEAVVEEFKTGIRKDISELSGQINSLDKKVDIKTDAINKQLMTIFQNMPKRVGNGG